LLQVKKDLPYLQNFEIKYGFEGFEERKKIIHRNFLIFKMDMELKIWECKV
jgi:hypothetical protein